MKPQKIICTSLVAVAVGSHAGETDQNISDADTVDDGTLEEVIVSAEKRDQSLQDTPIAISVLSAQQLEMQGISSLGDMMDGMVPSLRILPYSNTPSTLVMTIRGNGPGDVGHATRDGSVAVYLDDFFLGRASGLDMELVELERIEVLRGPQGTLFGRNATGGAISLVSRRPSGEFGLKQTLEVGSFDQHSSITHIDLPKWAGLSTKIDYVFTERDGWVNNTASDEADYNAWQKQGFRFSANRNFGESVELNYTYTNTRTDMSQNYFQLYRDDIGIIGVDEGRQTTTRYPIAPLQPGNSDQQMHSLRLDWQVSDAVKAQSLSSWRKLDDKARNNYGGAAYYDGVVEDVDTIQKQFSQEFRLLGSYDRIEWVTGLYYYKEDVSEAIRDFFSLDIFGDPPLTPINPPIEAGPERTIVSDIRSQAIYGQATWTPPVLDDRFGITLGLRHSREDRWGKRLTGGFVPFDLKTSQTDPMITLEYQASDQILTYAKWSNAYRSGGVSSFSVDLTPFDAEDVKTFELGLKAEGWHQRLRVNAALFSTDYRNMFIDVLSANLEFLETINAANKVTVDGGELDLTVKATDNLTIGLSYTYLSGDLPMQPNPYNSNIVERFYMTQTPRHAGALNLDYTFAPLRIGTFIGHLDVISSSRHNHWPTGGPGHPDAYTLFNARLILSDIPPGTENGALKVSLWGKNLTNEEYAIFGVDFGVTVLNTYNDPRTVGIGVTWEY